MKTTKALGLTAFALLLGAGSGSADTPLKTVAQISVGGDFACAVRSAGDAKCWGNNNTGQLGTGVVGFGSTYARQVLLSGMSAIAAGGVYGGHTCALLTGGDVKCWGLNSSGQLGSGSTTNLSMPPSSPVLSGATAVATGNAHTCALLAGGDVKCWGDNQYGQLGNGNTTSLSSPPSLPVLSGATAIEAGGGHTCALLLGGGVKCWGGNQYGQLGNGNTTNLSSPPASPVLSGATAIAAGSGHTCAVLSGGDLKCWGWNRGGQLGTGDTTDLSLPPAAAVLSGATSVAAGTYVTCALLAGGDVKCWGYSGSTAYLLPQPNVPATPKVSGATAIAAGGQLACAVMNDTGVKCWGHDGFHDRYHSFFPPDVVLASPLLKGVFATGVTTTGATLNASVNPQGNTTTVRFEYGLTMAYGGTTAELSAGSDIVDKAHSTGLSGLECGTEYHFRGVVTNEVASVTGPNASFTTLDCQPRITSAASARFMMGAAGSFSVTVTGEPVPTLSITGALPSGVTFDPSTGLIAGTPASGTLGSYPLVIKAANGLNPDATQNFTLTVFEGLVYTPVTPCRFVDGINAGDRVIAAANTTVARYYRVRGSLPPDFVSQGAGATAPAGCGVPLNAAAVMVNLTVADPDGNGDLRVDPAHLAQPSQTSVLNYTFGSQRGRNLANGVIVSLCDENASSCGSGTTPKDPTRDIMVTFHAGSSSVGTFFLADVLGYFAPASVSAGQAYTPVTPCRFVDGIHAGDRVPAAPNATTKRFYTVRGDTSSDFVSQGAAGTAPNGCNVPDDATAVMVNLTVADPDNDGDLKVDPSHLTEASPTSVLNYTFGGQRGKNLANGVIVSLCDKGQNACAVGATPKEPTRDMMVTFHAGGQSVTTFFLADVLGYFGPGATQRYAPITPCRFVNGLNAADRVGASPNSTVTRYYRVRGNLSTDFVSQGAAATAPSGCGVPSNATAVMVNLTVADPSGEGDLSVDPAHLAQPSQTSVLNYTFVHTPPYGAKNLANGLIVPLCDPTVSSCGSGLTPKEPTRDIMVTFHAGLNSMQTYFIADVLGYFLPTVP